MLNTAVRMFEQTAQKFSDKTAVVDANGSVTFAQLAQQAKAIGSALLAARGAAMGLTPLIVYLPKSIAAVSCYLGAQYSGNPYVPVADDIPMVRLESIAASLGEGFLITSRDMVSRLENVNLSTVKVLLLEDALETEINHSAIEQAVSAVIDSDPIYIMFTSGSTGVPKGVTIPHRGILDYADWLRDTFQFDEHTVLGNQSAFYFDNSTFDLYTMCRTGATVYLIPAVLFRFPTQLMEYVRDNRINTIFWVPTVMISVANHNALADLELPDLKKILFCGEVMPNRQLNTWRKALPDAMYANLYGPTEITDVCTYYIVDREFSDGDTLPIGKACRNMRALVLRPDNTLCDVGETGDLCIQGSALARGYWNAQEITRKAFVQNPMQHYYDDRMYRTGDLAYWAADGNLMFVGRADSQIKHRGNRIELGEIETAAKCIPAIGNAAALFDAEKEDIVLFAETDEKLILRKLNMELRKILPSYMLPTRLVCMQELPQTPNGKIDRVTLKSTF